MTVDGPPPWEVGVRCAVTLDNARVAVALGDTGDIDVSPAVKVSALTTSPRLYWEHRPGVNP